MGKAKVIKKIGDEGLYQVQLIYETRANDIRYIDKQINALFAKIRELQAEVEADISEDLPEDPAVEEDPTVEDSADPAKEDDPILIPDPEEPEEPEDDPPEEDQGSISGTVRGFE